LTPGQRAVARLRSAIGAGSPVSRFKYPPFTTGITSGICSSSAPRSCDALREHLQRAGIETGLHYPAPLQRQPCLAHLIMDRESFPRAEQWAREGLSLPLFYGMSDGQVDRVIRTMREFSFSA
jgi:dTDP-4-amino-4,6-dideoxygalactose transaminase